MRSSRSARPAPGLGLGLCLLLLGVAQAGAAEALRAAGPGVAPAACAAGRSGAACATDLLVACIARAERELCGRVGADPPEPGQRARRVQYRIDRESVIRAGQVGEDQRSMPWFRPGVTLVEFALRSCDGGEAACAREPWEEFQAYLRNRDGAWRVEHWRATGDADQGAQLPDAFAPEAP